MAQMLRVKLADNAELKAVSLTDRLELPTQRVTSKSGQMTMPAAIARTGGLRYTAKALGLDGDQNRIITVMRDEADVFSPESIQTFRSIPVTIGHPRDEAGNLIDVTTENAKELQVGTLEGLPVRDEDHLTGNIVLARQDAIDLVDEGVSQLSVGYTADLELRDEDGVEVIYQRNIVANHVAIVKKGRAGPSCSLADEDVTALEEEAASKLEADAKILADAEETAVKLADAVEQVSTLTDEVATLKAKLQVADEDLEAEKAKALLVADELETKVAARTELMINAKYILGDDEDLAGKSDLDIKRLVIADQMPKLDLSKKDDKYIEVRYEVILEDSERNEETPMSKILRDNAEPPAAVKYVDPSIEARKNMQTRQQNQAKL